MAVGQFKIGAIIQARLGSTRLPNKVLMPLNNGRTLLSQIVSQLKKTAEIDKIIVASSSSVTNDDLETYCKKLDIEIFRGDENDVLSRFNYIINTNNFNYVLRFTGDNPVIDTNFLSLFINESIRKNVNYNYSKNLPLGCNFEIIKSSKIIEARKLVTSDYDKEHVTSFIKRNYPEALFEFPIIENFKNLRLTVDYPSDYSLIQLILILLNNNELNLTNISKLISKNNWLKNVNQANVQKIQYKSIKDEINHILPTLKQLEMTRLLLHLKELQ